MDALVRTGDIQVEGQKAYSTSEVGEWIVDYIRKA
jgi:3-isopropylmalate dehydrogenase